MLCFWIYGFLKPIWDLKNHMKYTRFKSGYFPETLVKKLKFRLFFFKYFSLDNGNYEC